MFGRVAVQRLLLFDGQQEGMSEVCKLQVDGQKDIETGDFSCWRIALNRNQLTVD